MGTDLFNIIKNITNSIINLFNRNNIRDDDDSSNNSRDNSVSDSNFYDKLDYKTVDIKILTDPYMYPFFKNNNKLNDWPAYGSDDHDKMVNDLMNSKSHKYEYTYEYYDNLLNSIIEYKDNLKNESVPNLENLNQITKFDDLLEKTNEEYSIFIKAHKSKSDNDNELDKPMFTEKAYETSFDETRYQKYLEDQKRENYKEFYGHYPGETPESSPKVSSIELKDGITLSEKTFESNLKGKFKSMFESEHNKPLSNIEDKPKLKGIIKNLDINSQGENSESLVHKTVSFAKDVGKTIVDQVISENADLPLLDENKSVDLINPPLPPAPPAPPWLSSHDSQSSQSTDNPLLNSIAEF